MLDFSFGEITLVALVAFFIVGPKEFPAMMRAIGRWAGHCRVITDEFRKGFRSAMQQHGMGDVESDIASIREEMRFIRDQEGKLQRIYNFSDYMEEQKHSVETSVTLAPDVERIEAKHKN